MKIFQKKSFVKTLMRKFDFDKPFFYCLFPTEPPGKGINDYEEFCILESSSFDNLRVEPSI